MAFNMDSLTASIVSFIEDNNTTTSGGVSDGIYRKVRKVLRGRLDKLTPTAQEFPCVFVRVINKQEEYASLGNNSKRNQTVFVQISPVVNQLPTTNNVPVGEQNMYQLTSNLESLFRNNITLSGTVDSLIVANTDFDLDFGEEKSFNFYSNITLQITKLSN